MVTVIPSSCTRADHRTGPNRHPYATHRDINDVGQAALFALFLTFLPVQIVFVFTAVVLSAPTLLALRINAQL
jgi:hypothetical protein